VDEQLAILTRGADHIYSEAELRHKLTQSRDTGRPLRVKLGLDPTAPDIHLGHAVVLRKMRQFQDLGHKAVLIIGDYTARIGDPSGKTKTRPVLSDHQVDENADTYFEQAGQILDMNDAKIEVRRNSEWLGPLQFADALKLSSQMTVARMLERDTFAKRYKAGGEIYIHEFMYPLMQGYDSVAIESDVELGGTDQTFNNLVGRDLQRDAGQPPQVVLVMPILVGLDGTEKMSKSLGNYVGVTESPSDMFGKLMSLQDELMAGYFELLTEKPKAEIQTLLNMKQTHPRDAKIALALDVITQFHDEEAAKLAKEEFFRIHGKGKTGLPDEMPEVSVASAKVAVVDLINACGFANTNSEARRLVKEKGFRINGEAVLDPALTLDVNDGDIAQRGKRKFVRLKIG
jgi:tyrosyl-tRNA synthetase